MRRIIKTDIASKIDDHKARKNITGHKNKYKSQRKDLKLERDIVYIFTDGSSIENPGASGCGFVMIWNQYRKEFSVPIGSATSNIAELSAILFALQRVKNKKLPVVIYTDSMYCVGVISKNWNVKANKSLVQQIKDLIMEFSSVKLSKIKGHIGHRWNTQAHDLAYAAATKAKIDEEKERWGRS